MVNTFTFLYIYCQNIHILLHLWSKHSHIITSTVNNTFTFFYIYGQYIHIYGKKYTFYYICGQYIHLLLQLRSIHLLFITFSVLLKAPHWRWSIMSGQPDWDCSYPHKPHPISGGNHCKPHFPPIFLVNVFLKNGNNVPINRKKCSYITGIFFNWTGKNVPIEQEKMFL